MADFSAIENAADVSFIDDKTIDEIKNELVADFEEYMTSANGTTYTLDRIAENRMILYAAAAQIYQAMQYVDRAGKQSLLKYSYNNYLDNIGLLKGVTRLEATYALTTIKFTASASRISVISIPLGTRVTNGNGVYFQTSEYAEIGAGEEIVTVSAICTVSGEDGNDLPIGTITTIVDPVPYVALCANTTVTAGGADAESDSDLAERIYLAPSGYSVAGPADAYVYHAKNYSAAIGDVVATSDQAAGTVDVVFLLDDGSTPTEDLIEGLEEYLQDENIRPMTDLVTVNAPTEVDYSINFGYYINKSDSNNAVAIQTAVTAAVETYQTWQRVIGRDVNPSKLVELVMAAGAKRVELTAPTFVAIGSTAVSAIDQVAITYKGLEDD